MYVIDDRSGEELIDAVIDMSHCGISPFWVYFYVLKRKVYIYEE